MLRESISFLSISSIPFIFFLMSISTFQPLQPEVAEYINTHRSVPVQKDKAPASQKSAVKRITAPQGKRPDPPRGRHLS